MTKKVMVLAGGFSSEREVSLNSGKNIVTALKKVGYDAKLHDLTNTEKLLNALKKDKPDVVFNALHGNWGEDGTIPSLLDLMQIPYTHSGREASTVGMNKYLTKLVADRAGIPTAFGRKMTYREFKSIGATLARPFIVKPVSDGSSVGVYIVETPEDIFKIRYDNPETELVMEHYIPGADLTVMCLQGIAHVVTEIKVTDGFYDYNHKYVAGKAFHILPANLPPEVTERCKAYAETMHLRLGCKTVSRSDFRYNKEDGIIFLEINTHPGMTELSLVPEQAKYIGISYEELCKTLVEEASCRPLK